MVQEQKRCCVCIHVIQYGWHATKEECEITHESWCPYSGENKDRHNAKNCNFFTPKEHVWSNSQQHTMKSKDIEWI